MEVKDRIKEVIEYSGLSQAAFAKKIGMQQSDISNLIRGKKNPGPKFFARMVKIGVSVEWLKTGEGSMMMGAEILNIPGSDEPKIVEYNDPEFLEQLETAVVSQRNKKRAHGNHTKCRAMLELAERVRILEKRSKYLERRLDAIEGGL